MRIQLLVVDLEKLKQDNKVKDINVLLFIKENNAWLVTAEVPLDYERELKRNGTVIYACMGSLVSPL